MKILVVEDDLNLSNMLVKLLQDFGFVCDVVYDGDAAYERGCTEFYDAAILDLAEKIGADLIVMASHRPELKDYLLGPNAARVVRHAECSVMVVRR